MINMKERERQQITLAEQLKKRGASLVGFGDVSVVKSELTNKFPTAIGLAVKFDDAIVDNIHNDEPAFHKHQLEVRAFMEQLVNIASGLLHEWGYGYEIAPSKVINSNEELSQFQGFPYKTAATCAGLGWIGKSDLLITPEYGPRVRLAAILTDAPFKTAEPITEGRCGNCRLCVDACPNQAIKGAAWHRGVEREALLDPYVCNQKRLDYIPAIGRKYACGHCVQACPVGKGKQHGANKNLRSQTTFKPDER